MNGKPKKLRWDLAQAMYLRGMKAPQIAAAIGTTATNVRKHVVRHGWFKLKSQSTEAIEAQDGDLEQKSNATRHLIADQNLESLCLLSDKPIRTAREAEHRFDALVKSATVSEKVFGWQGGGGNGNGGLNVNFLMNARVVTGDEPRQAPDFVVESGPNGTTISTPYAEYCARNGSLPGVIDVPEAPNDEPCVVNERP